MNSQKTRGGWITWAARCLVSVVLLTLIVLFVDVRVLTRALGVIPVSVLGISFLLNLVGSIVVPAVQTRIALGATRIRLTVAQLIAINLMVRFYILVLPRPAAVGARWWAYRGAGAEGRGSEAAALMVFERVVQALVMSAALVLFLMLERDKLPAIADALLAVSIAMLAVAAVSIAAFLWAPAASIPRRLLSARRIPPIVRNLGKGLMEALEAYPGLPVPRVAAVVGLSAVYFVLFVASFWVLLLGLGVSVDFLAVAWIRAAVFILTLVPVTVAGIGLREAGFVGLLQLYGVPETEALAAALAALAVQLLLGGLGAGVVLVRMWRSPEETAAQIRSAERVVE